MKAKFEYSCASCGSGVAKPATGSSAKKGVHAGLHGWRCSSCGPTKVVRKVNKED